MNLSIKNLLYILPIIIGFYFISYEYKRLEFRNNVNIIEKIEQEDTDSVINISNIKNLNENKAPNKIDIKLNKVEITISEGDTLFSILKNFGLSNNNTYEIIRKIEEFYNLKNLKINDKIIFLSDNEKNISKIKLNLGIDSILIINISDKITSEIKKLKKEEFKISNEFIIQESLYSDGLKNDLPQEILIKLIKLFSFDLDFQRDIKKNTLVSVSYDFNHIKDNNKFEYKDINYALISINGKDLEYFKFITDDGYLDYFNRKGKNVKKSLLKTPLDGARLSSNFGMRKHPISGYNKMHKGVDFAAPMGTPIYAGGNGIIEYVGNNGGYGKYIRIRHNNDYKTAYAHLSGYNNGISKGVRVNQGDIIGFVGNTGNSTGPHLHYEIIFQNKQINPLKLKLPSGKILKGKEFKKFEKKYKQIYAEHLNLLYE